MGCFGWLCSKCDKPVLADTAARGFRWASEAVVVTKRAGAIRGTYDGYGRCGMEENLADLPEVRLVHQRCYAHERSAELKVSAHDPNQSVFYGWKALENLFGPPNLDELYERNFCCLKCKNLFRGKWYTECPHCGDENIDAISHGQVIASCGVCSHTGLHYAPAPGDDAPRCGSFEHYKQPQEDRPILTLLNPFSLLDVLAHIAVEADDAQTPT